MVGFDPTTYARWLGVPIEPGHDKLLEVAGD
jgi:hypothetical protein